jgi:uncharacterized protein (DUF885 family)
MSRTTNNHSQLLAQLTDDFLHAYFAFFPTAASSLGLHEYDGQVTDLSSAAIERRVATLQQQRQRLEQIAPHHLERLEAFDYALLHWRIDAELWGWTEQREHTRNPMIYIFNATVDTYIKRNYAPLEVRAAALVRHLHQLPQTMQAARHNLVPHIPRVLIEETLNIASGLVSFLTYSVPETFGRGSDNPPLRDNPRLERDIWIACDVAVATINDFCAYLLNELLPVAHDDFAIGAEHFRNMLRYNELVDIPLEHLLAIGEADLEKNKAAIIAIARQLDPNCSIQEQMGAMGRNHPGADNLLDETRNLLGDLRDFLIARDLVTLPTDVPCYVEETPPYDRWAFAMMDTAGPFEQEAIESFYYITLPEADWPPEQVEGWLTRFDYATLTGMSIHEAYPGHYVHFTTARNAPTRLARVFDTYTHYESWAHYSEQMMLEQGYGNGDLHLHMAQLAEALVRNCRYICAIKMHTQGMTLEEATNFFREHAYMDEVTATKEARRGTHDPGYLSYTLGKLMLLKLLEDYKAAYGDTFSLKRFHDEYIGYGSPPIPILRSMLLPDDNKVLL